MQTAAVPSEECSGESTQHGEHGRVDAANRERASLQMSGGGQSRGLQRTGARVRARVPVAEHAAEHAATHACNTRLPRSSYATASAAAFTRTHYCNTSAERSRTQRPSEVVATTTREACVLQHRLQSAAHSTCSVCYRHSSSLLARYSFVAS